MLGLKHIQGKSQGNVDVGIKLLIVGITFLLIGIFVVETVAFSVISQPVNNESLGNIAGNITAFTVNSPKMASAGIVVRNISTAMTNNESFDADGCANVPCYDIIDRGVGTLNVTMCYPYTGVAQCGGANDTTQTIFIDYTIQRVDSDVALSTAQGIQTTARSGFVVAGVALMIIGAAIILGLLDNI